MLCLDKCLERQIPCRRYLLRCISLVVPDTFLNASIISITDTKAHKKTTVENVIAQIIGKGIWNMTAGAVVTRVVVTDTEPAFSQRLVSIDSICVQWVRLASCTVLADVCGQAALPFTISMFHLIVVTISVYVLEMSSVWLCAMS